MTCIPYASSTITITAVCIQQCLAPLPVHQLPVKFTSEINSGWRLIGCAPVEPSHASQLRSQPLENQKQAWPLDPVRLRSSTAPLDGKGHHGSKGNGCGTAPPHGCLSESTEFRGLGIVIAECAEAAASQAVIKVTEPTIRPRLRGPLGRNQVANSTR